MVMNQLIEPGLIKLCSLLESLFLPSIVVSLKQKRPNQNPLFAHIFKVVLS